LVKGDYLDSLTALKEISGNYGQQPAQSIA
jgi:hypothetical protein